MCMCAVCEQAGLWISSPEVGSLQLACKLLSHCVCVYVRKLKEKSDGSGDCGVLTVNQAALLT